MRVQCRLLESASQTPFTDLSMSELFLDAQKGLEELKVNLLSKVLTRIGAEEHQVGVNLVFERQPYTCVTRLFE